jgi:antitoxin VapB
VALNIKDADTDRLARELAAITGESITVAARIAIEERLSRVRRQQPHGDRAHALREIVERIRALPVLDDRSPDEIVGYDEDGLPS